MHIWIFFGQSGSGKCFVGRVCAKEFGFERYDGDRYLTPEMLRALASSAYARFVNGGFEPPAPRRDILENDGDRARVVDQLKAYLG